MIPCDGASGPATTAACRRGCLVLLIFQAVAIFWLFQLALPARPVTLEPVLPAVRTSAPRTGFDTVTFGATPSSQTPVSGETVFEGPYLVHTTTCQIPNADAFDVTLRKFIKPPDPVQCRKKRQPPLAYSDMNSVHLVLGRQHLYGASPPLTTVSCCTRDVSWNSTVDLERVRKGIDRSVLTECRPLTDSYTPYNATGVQVTCRLKAKEVYRDYFHFVPPTRWQSPEVAPGANRRGRHQVKPSVLIIFFDAVSRLQFERWFPRSRRFLIERLGAFELAGLNKEADNTWPNAVPLMSGLGVPDLLEKCVEDPKKIHLDDCPFIWKEFKAAGYRTLLFEDSARLGTFTYLKRGFSRQPTDDYSLATRYLMEKHIGHTHPVNTYFCMGTRPSPTVSLKYVSDLARQLAAEPYWAAVIMDSFTHDSFAKPGLLDEPYYRTLESLHDAGALNNTIVITMGDHGLRWGGAHDTLIGGLEERLPLMSLAFPEWLRKLYPQAFLNLKHNQRRLTSFRDVHATLRALLHPEETLGSASLAEAALSGSAVSLFQRVPELRRCEDCHIPPQFCTCLSSRELSVKDSRAQKAAQLVVSTLNKELKKAPQCAQLQLKGVLSARLQQEPQAIQVVKKPKPRRQLIRLLIQTKPGDAHLEATVMENAGAMVLTGSVARNDRYGHLIWCVHDHVLEKYCHCGPKPATDTPKTANTTAGATRSAPKDSTTATVTTTSTVKVPVVKRTSTRTTTVKPAATKRKSVTTTKPLERPKTPAHTTVKAYMTKSKSTTTSKPPEAQNKPVTSETSTAKTPVANANSVTKTTTTANTPLAKNKPDNYTAHSRRKRHNSDA